MNKYRLVVSLATALTVLALASCTTERGNNPTPKEDGNPSDANFVITESVVETMDEDIFAGLGDVVGSISSIGGFTMSAAKNGSGTGASVAADTFTWHPESEYWYNDSTVVETLYTATEEIEDITTFYRRDSIQFLHNNDPVQYPDSLLLTRVIFGSYFTADGSLTDNSLSAVTVLDISGAPGELAGAGNAVFNYTHAIEGAVAHAEADSFSCGLEINWTASGAGVALDLAAVANEIDCPYAGEVTHEGNLHAMCEGANGGTFDYSDHWTAQVEFVGDEQNYTFENATTRWEGSDTCDAAPPTVSALKFWSRRR